MGVCVFKDHKATWVGLYLWVCRLHVHAAMRCETYGADNVLLRSSRLQMCARRCAALAHFSLSNRNLLDHKSKMWVCVSACWEPGHNVQMDGYQSLCVHVQVLTVTGVVRCLWVDWWVMQSLWVCAWWGWTQLRFKPSENLPRLHKKCFSLFIRLKAVYIQGKTSTFGLLMFSFCLLWNVALKMRYSSLKYKTHNLYCFMK